jgi:hypothetical protein
VVEVLIENTHRLDVNEGFDFSFNYSIADIRTPESRQTEYSKTIVCPGTHSNNVLFGHIFDVNIGNDYDPTEANVGYNFNSKKKAKAVVLRDGMPIVMGYIQLRQIVTNNGVMGYHVAIIGRSFGLFSAMGEKFINGIDDDGINYLDFSSYDHIYRRQDITASWTNTDGYVYPMIDYGSTVEFNSDGERIYYTADFRPAVYAKTILDKIFDYCGYTYTSDFLTGDIFTKLIVPHNQEVITTDYANVSDRYFKVSYSGTPDGDVAWLSGGIGFVRIPMDDETTGSNTDPGANWNNTVYQYAVPNNGYYSFHLQSSISMLRTISSPTRSYQGFMKLKAQVRKVDLYGNAHVLGETLQQFDLTGNPFPFNESLDFTTSASDVTLLLGEYVYCGWQLEFDDLQIFNTSGQQIPSSNLFTDFNLTTTSSILYNEPSAVLFEGDLITLNEMLPPMKMKDFVTSIFKMFNLYITVDPTNDENVLIEPRDTFYQDGNLIDWTHKLDRKGNIEVQPLGMLSASDYLFTYQGDKDYYNSDYEARFSKVYGERRIETGNEFLNETKEISVEFSPSPLVNDGSTDRIITKIYNNNITGGPKTTESNVRILFYDLLSSVNTWVFGSFFTFGTTQTNYPYAGHLDNPVDPDNDLNFGLTNLLYYSENAATGQINVTNANLYRLYHKAYVDEMTDKDSKVMRGSFRLTHLDLQKLDFRDTILIDNTFWRLNWIKNYNPFTDGLCRVELIRASEVPKSASFKSLLGQPASAEGERYPMAGNRRRRNQNVYPEFQGTVRGYNNYVDPSAVSFEITGDNNTIGAGARNVVIEGDNNTVNGGLRNVTITGSTGVHATTSGTWLNNQEVSTRAVVDGGFDVVTPLNAGTSTRVIDPGLDAIQNDSGHSDIYLIDG